MGGRKRTFWHSFFGVFFVEFNEFGEVGDGWVVVVREEGFKDRGEFVD